jgi:hypothetical protein
MAGLKPPQLQNMCSDFAYFPFGNPTICYGKQSVPTGKLSTNAPVSIANL